MQPTAGAAERDGRPPHSRAGKRLLIFGCAAVVGCGVLLALATGWFSRRGSADIETNESLIEASRTSVNVDDAAAVFQHVFSALPWRAIIYPSGNHYYFSFACTRGLVQGNLWLSPELRAAGMIGIAYSLGVPGRDKTVSERLGRRQGLYLAAVGQRAWLCYYHWRTVVFVLNHGAAAPPSQARLLPGESWVVPVFDESGLQFQLVFQEEPAHLFWILNQDQPVAEDFDFIASGIAIGRRTRFAFYVDEGNHRWILVGVDRRNTMDNTWYDGPFDQLPAEIGAGRYALRQRLEKVYPSVRGQIDDLGRFKLLPEMDVGVMPWTLYDKVDDLTFIGKCKQELSGPAFYSCITPDRFAGKK
jgi:hypothetical protein